MEKLEKIDRLLRQFPHGITAAELAEKMDIKRTAVYDFLNSLAVRGKAESRDGLWFSKQEQKPPVETERERLLDALIGYHEPVYFKRLDRKE